MKRTAPLAAALVVLMALPAHAEKLSLDTISNYLNDLVTAETRFTQTNADGSTSTGTLVIRRPGRMRFEYDPPEKSVVLASAGTVAIFDGKSNQPPEQYPLKRTPLNLILAQRVDLKRQKMVTGHAEVDGRTLVTAQDPEHPEIGTITLSFSESPVALTQWVVTDEYGGQTVVVLDKLKTGTEYPPSFFQLEAELQKRGLN